eukprot:scaffold705_cov402-Prasinococcus_capsulatus_cf.AAC.43
MYTSRRDVCAARHLLTQRRQLLSTAARTDRWYPSWDGSIRATALRPPGSTPRLRAAINQLE